MKEGEGVDSSRDSTELFDEFLQQLLPTTDTLCLKVA